MTQGFDPFPIWTWIKIDCGLYPKAESLLPRMSSLFSFSLFSGPSKFWPVIFVEAHSCWCLTVLDPHSFVKLPSRCLDHSFCLSNPKFFWLYLLLIHFGGVHLCLLCFIFLLLKHQTHRSWCWGRTWSFVSLLKLLSALNVGVWRRPRKPWQQGEQHGCKGRRFGQDVTVRVLLDVCRLFSPKVWRFSSSLNFWGDSKSEWRFLSFDLGETEEAIPVHRHFKQFFLAHFHSTSHEAAEFGQVLCDEATGLK